MENKNHHNQGKNYTGFDDEIRLEAGRAILNMILSANSQNVRALAVDKGCIRPLCDFLTVQENDDKSEAGQQEGNGGTQDE